MCFHPGVVDKTNKNTYIGGLEKWIDRIGSAKCKKNILEDKWVLTPCGQCLACRIQYAANWAARCELETNYHKQSIFLTLTYDEEHVPVLNKETGEIYRGVRNPAEYVAGVTLERMTVYKPDIQKFIKRLRKAAEKEGLADHIMYYLSGEYGDKTGRPHYHLIVYGLEVPDAEHIGSRRGYDRFTSEWLKEVWGMGLIEIGSVTYESCQYVARYVIKKRKGKDAKEYKDAGIMPEFVQMSLKPAIGQRYWEEHKDEIYSLDQINLASGRTVKPPRYFDKLEDREMLMDEIGQIESLRQKFEPDCEMMPGEAESDFMRDIKTKRRKTVLTKTEARWRATNLDLREYYEMQERNFENKNKLAKNRGIIDE